MPPSSPPPSATLGPRLRAARVAKGITQLSLAHALGYTGTDAGACISRWEAGTQVPGIDTIAKIAEALGVKLENLLGQ